MDDISRAWRASWRHAAVLTALMLSLATVADPATAGVGAGPSSSWSQAGPDLWTWEAGTVTNAALVTNGGTGRDRSAARSALVRTDDEQVSVTNVARAHAWCTDCRTVAVAFEVVLAGGEPTDLTFVNQAVAINDRCVGCETVAMAYQIAVVAPGVTLSDAGVQALQGISGQIRSAAAADVPVDQVVADVNALVGQAVGVLDTELSQSRPALSSLARTSGAPAVVVRSEVDRG